LQYVIKTTHYWQVEAAQNNTTQLLFSEHVVIVITC